MIFLCCKTSCCFDQIAEKNKFSSTGPNKSNLEETGAGPLEKYKRVLDEKNESSIHESWIPSKSACCLNIRTNQARLVGF